MGWKSIAAPSTTRGKNMPIAGPSSARKSPIAWPGRPSNANIKRSAADGPHVQADQSFRHEGGLNMARRSTTLTGIVIGTLLLGASASSEAASSRQSRQKGKILLQENCG